LLLISSKGSLHSLHLFSSNSRHCTGKHECTDADIHQANAEILTLHKSKGKDGEVYLEDGRHGMKHQSGTEHRSSRIIGESRGRITNIVLVVIATRST